MSTKKILVTGGCGFIGSHTVVELIQNGYEPVIVDSLENSEEFIHGNLQELTKKTISFYKVNCLDFESLRKVFLKENFHGVIHFAAYKSVGESVNNPLKYYQNNIQSLVNILKLCDEFRIHDFVFSSSCTVYGNPPTVCVTEETPLGKSESAYSSTKQICELLIHDHCKSNRHIRTVMLRYFNPVGAHPSAMIGELPIGVPSNLVPYITQTAAGKRERLTIYGNDYPTPDGTCVRDYIHVSDIASAHVLALQKLNSMSSFPEVYNLGTGKGNTVMQVVKTFESVTGKPLNYYIGPRRPGDVISIYADNTKAINFLGWKCKYTLEDCLRHSWEWEKNYTKFIS